MSEEPAHVGIVLEHKELDRSGSKGISSSLSAKKKTWMNESWEPFNHCHGFENRMYIDEDV